MVEALAACVLLASLSPAGNQPTGQSAAVIEQVLLRENAYTDSLLKRDLPELQSVLADSFTDTGADGQTRRKIQFLAWVQRAPPLESIIIQDRHVRVRGARATVTETYTQHGIRQGKAFVESGHSTNSWVSQNGHWYCVASRTKRAFRGTGP